jgi:ribosome-binding factor A
MPTKRQRRVAEQIRIILSEAVQFEADDPRLADITIVDVKIDHELQYADVYVYALSGETGRDQVMEGLRSAAAFLRRVVGDKLQIRHVPELRFQWDKTLSHAEHIHDLLDSLDIPPDETSDDTESDE